MTPEQIRERCEEFGETWDFTREQLNDLESLYREAMAEGLERAAVEMVYSGNDKLNGWIEWCRQEAQRVKEGA